MKYLIEKVINYPFSSFLIFVIWVVCMLPVPETPLSQVRFIDKWTHFLMYGGLTFTIWVEYIRKRRMGWKHSTMRLLMGGMLCPVVMGCLVELAQAYLTTCRSGDIFDALCNSIGVVLGCLLGYLYSSGSKSRHKG